VKGELLTKRMGNISIDFLFPNPFSNWGSKGVIYFSFVKLLVKIQDQRWGGRMSGLVMFSLWELSHEKIRPT